MHLQLALVLLAGLVLVAPLRADPAMTPPPAAESFDPLPLLETLVRHGDDEWRGDRWGDRRGDRLGFSVHMVYVALHAAHSGDTTRLDRIGVHFRTLHGLYWNDDLGCYVDAPYYITNADEGWCLAATLTAAGDRLDPALRGEMEAALAAICRYLPTRTTSAWPKPDDFRASNQDAFAAATLAMAAAYFDDAAIRAAAVEKTELIAGRVDGPFWIEGGIDRDYQRIGEPGFAIAVDLLWDQLSPRARRAAAEMAMRPLATRGLGLETTRSASTLSVDPPFGDLAAQVAWLRRVPHPLAAHGVLQWYRGDATRVAASAWWWNDLSPACMNWAFIRHADAIRAIPADPPRVSWGGAARVQIGEGNGGRDNTGDFKAFIAGDGDGGVAAMFGDPSLQNPAHTRAKRGIETLPEQWNPGGLRYVGWGNRLAVMADARHSLPRPVLGDDPADDPDLHTLAARTDPGFLASQYRLRQRLGDTPSAPVLDQSFVALGDTLLIRLSPAAGDAADLAWQLSIAAAPGSATATADAVAWRLSDRLPAGVAHGPDAAILAAADGGAIALHDDTLTPFLANESIRVTGPGGRPASTQLNDPLARVVVPVATPRWLVLAPGDAPPAVERRVDGETGVVTLRRGGEVYIVIEPRVDGVLWVDTAAGRLTLDAPEADFLHVVHLRGDRLAGFHLHARGARLGDESLFTAPASARVSMGHAGDHRYVEIDGESVRPGPAIAPPAGSGTSLLDGRPVDPAAPLTAARFYFPASQ